MNKNQLTDVFFDLDHTLWDFDRNSKLAFARVFNRHDMPIMFDEFMEIYVPINYRYWKMYREGDVTKQQLRRGRFIDTFSDMGKSFPMETIDALADTYIEELPGSNHLFDGAMHILNYLNTHYKLHIITNGFNGVQQLKLQKSGIAHFFNTVTTSEEAAAQKPNPKIFFLALDKANTKPEKSIMIGDTYEADILGAEGVGMRSIYYNYRKENIPKHNTLVDHLMELKEHL